ncbi:MAG: zonular occludens toxin domain-containing protein, partial [Nitrospira sp.]|nr:zonular occludens toxin domain-containing protein [Nitrospira sp.]
MITLLEGVPGSGKSYHAVSEYLLPEVRKERRIYCYVDGVYMDRLAIFEGRELSELQAQVTTWGNADEVRQELERVEPGSFVFLDEIQTVFRSGERIAGNLLRFLETHRHYGVDIVATCQAYGQVAIGFNRLVETTIKFRRMDRLGVRGRYQAWVRGNPEELETIRKFMGKFQPRIYSYYGSYARASIRETERKETILKSPVLWGAALLIVGIIWWLNSSDKWISGPGYPDKPLPPPVTKEELKVVQAQESGVKVSEVVRIEGGMLIGGRAVWVDDKGEFLTMNDLVMRTGASVTERIENGK